MVASRQFLPNVWTNLAADLCFVLSSTAAITAVQMNTIRLIVKADMFGLFTVESCPHPKVEGSLCECGSCSVSKHKVLY